jgi:hypothetical protein
MTKVFWLAGLVAGPMTAQAADPARDCCAGALRGYPAFCAIPPMPAGVRDAEEFKVAVVDVRQAGRRAVEQSTADSVALVAGQTESFGAEARAEVAWPGSMGPGDTAAFAAEARRKATPPARPRR